MRCKKHLSDLSSSVGVCASCLRDRLFALIAAQALQAQAQAQSQTRDDHRKTDQHPPPLVFPRSVSPYVSRRKSDHVISDHRFYSTPQIGPTTAAAVVETTGSRKSRYRKFSIFSNLFRSRLEKSESDPRVSSSSSNSWFSNMIHGRRAKQSRTFSLPDSMITGRRPHRTSDRGMSPAKRFDDDEAFEDLEGSPSASGYSSESSQGWKRTPIAPASSTRRIRAAHSRNVSGFAFCLSPLVRASPNRQWNQKCMPPEVGITGEIRVPVKPHLSAAASFCANRSRKLADYGRQNYNH